MFWKKKCKDCSGEINDKWNFCPSCGSNLNSESGPFNNMFDDIDKELRRMGKTYRNDLSKFPKFGFGRIKPKAGINITITSGAGMTPKVEIKGGDNYKKIDSLTKPEMGNLLSESKRLPEKEIRLLNVTEEPVTKIQKLNKKQVITIHLPDVKENNLEIRQLEQSIEIRAVAGDKGYFKLIPIPANASVDKEFKDGVLKIEVVR